MTKVGQTDFFEILSNLFDDAAFM
jgi:hypothetical protein